MQQVGGDDLDDFEIEQGFIPSGSEAEWMDPYEIQGMESTEENSDSGKMESVSPAVKKRKREQKDSGKSGKSPKVSTCLAEKDGFLGSSDRFRKRSWQMHSILSRNLRPLQLSLLLYWPNT